MTQESGIRDRGSARAGPGAAAGVGECGPEIGRQGSGEFGLDQAQLFDHGERRVDAVVTRAEFDRPLAGIVQRLDRDGDGGLSMKDRWDDDDDDRRGRDDD